MANLQGGVYITFEKPYLNMLAEKITSGEKVKFDGNVEQKVNITKDVKLFLNAVKSESDAKVSSVIRDSKGFRPLFNGYRWTEIDKGQFTGKGGSSDAKSTQLQELGSLFAIQKGIENNGYSDQKKFMQLYRADLKKIYPDMNEDWENTFFQQQLTTHREVGNTKYNHYSRDGGFMDYITDLCKSKYGIAKKDTWNPADIWLVSDLAKVKRILKEKVLDDVTSIEEFNAILRDMFKERMVVGISLKKMSGKTASWELVNLEDMDIFDDKEYNFKLDSIDLNLKVGASGDLVNSDTKIVLEGKKGKIKFQVRQNSAGFNNLKIEGTDLGATAARLGKVPLDMAANAFKKEKLEWDNSNKNYPRNAAEFAADIDKYKVKFNRVKKYTGLGTEKDFEKNIIAAFNTNRPDYAHSKLMQLHLVSEIMKLKEEQRNDLLTTMAYLAQKKGKVFGPFGKLY